MTIDAAPTALVRIEWALDRFFADRAQQAATYGPQYVDLWAIAGEHARGGKLLRPRLFIDALEAFESAASTAQTVDTRAVEPEAVDRLAAMTEVLHYAFLLHDDVIDGDLVRRHRPNLIRTVQDLHPAGPTAAAHHWGTSAAILMGDLLLSSVLLETARLALPAGSRTRVLDLLDEAITETVAGEHLDVALGDGFVAADLPTVSSMTTLKTATYSFALPLRLAGALTHAPTAVDRALGDVGRGLGFAFQVQDDLLTMFGHHAAHGKDELSDLREGKQTVLVAFARTTDRWDEIAELIGDADICADDADRVRTVLEESGARAFAEELIAARLSDVARTLATAVLPAQVSRVVADCMSRIEGRVA